MDRRGALRRLGSTILGVGAGSSIARAKFPERHARKACDKRAVPLRPYEDDRPRLSVSAITFLANSDAVGLPRDLDGARVPVRRKYFMLQATRLDVDALTLRRFGLAIYETGELSGNALVSHSGGPEGRLFNGEAVIRLRAINSGPGDALSAAAFSVWENETRRRVSKGTETQVALGKGVEPMIRRHFDEIDHFEVILESWKDR